MLNVPSVIRAIAFVDGQNLFYAAKKAFGHTYPNYDPKALAVLLAKAKGWTLTDIYFYTGIPDHADEPRWNMFWTKKLGSMGHQGVKVKSRPIRYHTNPITCSHCRAAVKCPTCGKEEFRVGREKGVDVRLALDVVRLALDNQFDVAVIFSQDQDLVEAAEEVKLISLQQKRWMRVACAFPLIDKKSRGINGTQWITIDQDTYDLCLDKRDYRV